MLLSLLIDPRRRDSAQLPRASGSTGVQIDGANWTRTSDQRIMGPPPQFSRLRLRTFLLLRRRFRLHREPSDVIDSRVARRTARGNFCVSNLGWIIENEGEKATSTGWMVLRTGPSDMFLRPITQFADF
jgi:hypothetical protein